MISLAMDYYIFNLDYVKYLNLLFPIMGTKMFEAITSADFLAQ